MILHGAVPFGSSLFRSPSRSVRRLLCISLWVVQGLHGGLPLLGGRFFVVGFRPRSRWRPLFWSMCLCPSSSATLWVPCIVPFPLASERRQSLSSPRSFRMGLEPLYEASLRALSLEARLLVFLPEAASLHELTTLSCVLPFVGSGTCLAFVTQFVAH